MAEREILEVDVLIVGGGPAGLAAAYHLRRLNRDVSIAVLEKGKEIGAHTISGAVMDPRGIRELMPDWTIDVACSILQGEGQAPLKGIQKLQEVAASESPSSFARENVGALSIGAETTGWRKSSFTVAFLMPR